LPANGRKVLSAVATWGIGSTAPTITWDRSLVGDAPEVTISGIVQDADRDRVFVALETDGDASSLVSLGASLPSGSSFSYEIQLNQLFRVGGSHTLELFAVDQTGMVSSAGEAVVVNYVPAPVTQAQSSKQTPVSTPERTNLPERSALETESGIVTQTVPERSKARTPTEEVPVPVETVPERSELPAKTETPEPDGGGSSSGGSSLSTGSKVGIAFAVVMIVVGVAVVVVIVWRRQRYGGYEREGMPGYTPSPQPIDSLG
jgi:hypothetical protein